MKDFKKVILGCWPLLVTIIIALIIYNLKIKTTWAEIEKLEEKIINKELKLKEFKNLDFIFNRQLKEEVLDKEDHFQALLPEDEKLNQLLEELEMIFSNNKLKIDTFLLLEKINEGDYIRLPIDLSFSGDYQSIIKSFKELDNLRRIVNIKYLSIDSKEHYLEVKLLLELYSLSQDKVEVD